MQNRKIDPFSQDWTLSPNEGNHEQHDSSKNAPWTKMQKSKVESGYPNTDPQLVAHNAVKNYMNFKEEPYERSDKATAVTISKFKLD